MKDDKLLMKGSAWTYGKISIPFICQRYIRFLMLLLTPVKRITIDPEMHRYQTETSLASKPRSGTWNLMAVLGILEITVRLIFFHHPSGVIARAREVEGGADFFEDGVCTKGMWPWYTGVGIIRNFG